MRDPAPDGLDLVATRDGAVVFDWNPADGPSAAVAVPTAVAATLGSDPVSLPPLARTVDPEDLHGLVADATGVSVSFTYEGCRVLVDAVGRLRVVE